MAEIQIVTSQNRLLTFRITFKSCFLPSCTVHCHPPPLQTCGFEIGVPSYVHYNITRYPPTLDPQVSFLSVLYSPYWLWLWWKHTYCCEKAFFKGLRDSFMSFIFTSRVSLNSLHLRPSVKQFLIFF
jgi:hypothetical protein